MPCYEDLKRSTRLRTPALIRAGLEAELDKFTFWPDAAPAAGQASSTLAQEAA